MENEEYTVLLVDDEEIVTTSISALLMLETDYDVLVLLCQLGCPRTSRPLDWHEKVCCHAVCLPLANMEHGVADPRYKRLLG